MFVLGEQNKSSEELCFFRAFIFFDLYTLRDSNYTYISLKINILF